MNILSTAKELLKLATLLDQSKSDSADILTQAAEELISIAEEKAYSIHMTYTNGSSSPVHLVVDVREKATGEWSVPSMEPVESFSFDGKNVGEVNQKSAPKVAELKQKYGVEQVLQNMDPSLPK